MSRWPPATATTGGGIPVSYMKKIDHNRKKSSKRYKSLQKTKEEIESVLQDIMDKVVDKAREEAESHGEDLASLGISGDEIPSLGLEEVKRQLLAMADSLKLGIVRPHKSKDLTARYKYDEEGNPLDRERLRYPTRKAVKEWKPYSANRQYTTRYGRRVIGRVSADPPLSLC